ncbi:MAG TPA: sulfatase-like hydrolase/transferase [Acetobacteraceae bacterium]
MPPSLLAAGIAVCVAAWLVLRAGVGASLRDAPVGAILLDALPMAAGFGLMLAGTARPLLSGVALGATALGLRLTDTVKRDVLHEPVNFADRAELPEVVRHPQLYLPFAGTGLVLAGAGVIAALAGALAWAEPPMWHRSWPEAIAALLLALAAARLGFVLPALRPALRFLAPLYARLQPSRDPAQDMLRLGPLATLVIHATLAAAERPDRVATVRARPAPALPADGPVIVVQAESFMDPARLHPALAGALPHWSALRAGAVRRGALEVPCWGANTVRSEFAVLTGVGETALGLDRFNPYEAFARGGLPSIAGAARAAGYRTVVVHPFDPGFYGRKHVMPRLGFDRFVGPEAFRHAPAGHYPGDSELAAVVAGLVREMGPRVFVFVINMASHGPWTGNPAALPPELAGIAEAGPLAGWLEAMRGTDAMLPALADALREAGTGWLAVYGDHQPSLPGAFAALGVADRRTDYLVWGVGQPPGVAQDCSADALGRILAEAMSKA